jgi:glycosyltransferase involved in cell wall biosynthesis
MAIQRLFDGLRTQGVDPIVYCPQLEPPGPPDPIASSGFRVERFRAFVPILGLSRQRRRQLVAVGGNLMSFDLISSLWWERGASLIHTHALGRIGGIGLTIAKQRQIPFVVTIHGGVLDLPEHIKRSFNAPIDHGWEWGRLLGFLFQSHRLFCDADAMFTCNAKEAALLQERFPAKRILVQPHGVPLEAYQADQRVAAESAFPQIRGRDVLLCLGRIDPIKNQRWLLDQAPAIFRRHRNALLVFAGPCTDEPYGAAIRQRIGELGLENKVLLTGGLPPNDPRIVGLLQAARTLLLPSLSETFGLVILEAWAAGTTVVSARASGPAAMVQHGHNGWLFDLNDPQGFHEALASILADPIRAKQMACNGGEIAEQHSVAVLAGRVKALYDELIEAKQCAT